MADDEVNDWWLQDDNTENNELPVSVSYDEEQKKKSKKKRKLKEDDTVSEQPKKKKKKNRKRKKITEELSVLKPGSAANEDLIAILKKTYEGKLSPVEQDEIELDIETDFFSNNADKESPAAYLKSILPRWSKIVKKSKKNPGEPQILILCSSGARAVEVNRNIKDFKGDLCKTAKLFAKHFKLEEQIKYISAHSFHLGIGTPNRMAALIKTGCLHLDQLQAVVIDWNWRDVKSKRIIDIPEIRSDLLTLLKDAIIPCVKNTQCRIAIM